MNLHAAFSCSLFICTRNFFEVGDVGVVVLRDVRDARPSCDAGSRAEIFLMRESAFRSTAPNLAKSTFGSTARRDRRPQARGSGRAAPALGERLHVLLEDASVRRRCL